MADALVHRGLMVSLVGSAPSVMPTVGMIALLGIATETASIMMVYLDQGYETWRKEGRLNSLSDLIDMTVESATLRVRPLVMTVGMNIVGLVPVMMGRTHFPHHPHPGRDSRVLRHLAGVSAPPCSSKRYAA